MKIAAFNARRFGVKKCADSKVFSIITQIVSRYDIIVILEVFDSKEKAAKKLIEQLNSCDKNTRYNYVLSKPLGRNEYKEQYLFVFREDMMKVKDIYQYADMQHGDEDSFAREPFIVRFESKITAAKDLILIPVHTTPKDSVQEIDELYDVYLDVKEKWGTQNIIFLGDFNADGAYVSKKKMKTIRLRTDVNFHWLIEDDIDTTATKTTDCSYDRIVVHEDLLQHIVPNSAKPFNYQDEYKLTDEEALAVSDHYPVEVELKPAKGKSAKK
ncbi:deoxyribonuclease gamma-like [Spea bombifrons]|uniref:deoxyribonuclease gamma-like n=1 Tax=Spea bombifrons TaxID=233779 RepID=UPI00234BDD58|nr:deoxyribonuclease gamma-like [Spea bombifrons]XP_053324945.1 deoxyribonuclease gamma-like [Spea bombifrons]